MSETLELERGWSNTDQALFDRHVVNLDEGKLGGGGGYRSTKKSVENLVKVHLAEALEDAKRKGVKLKVMLQAHGGLVSEKAALTAVKKYALQWKNSGVYPIYFVWETGLFNTLKSFLPFGERAERGWGDRRDRATEVAARALATPVWGRMKKFAAEASADGGGARFFAEELAKFTKDVAGDLDFYAMGHSAGSIFHSYFLPVLKGAGGPKVEELFLLAPAIRVDEFYQRLEPLIGPRKFVKFCSHFTMKEELERADQLVAFLYSKSLLYFVRGACEGKEGGDILGLECDLQSNPGLQKVFGIGQSSKQGEMIFSTTSTSGTRSSCQSKTHGGFDDDIDTLNSLFIRMTGRTSSLPFAMPVKAKKKSFWKKLFGRERDFEAGGGRKLALCVGIDKYRSSPLGGCVNDSNQWAAALESQGFEVETLNDEEGTRENLIEGLQCMVKLSKPGDVLVFQFAGHGTHLPDLNGDEHRETENDVDDEALVPFDYYEGDYLVDDDIGVIIDQLSPGVNLTCFLDCCHSGTGSRGLFKAGSRSLGQQSGERVRYMKTTNELRERYLLKRANQITSPSGAARRLREVTFAACQDGQTAKEENGHGFFTITACPLMERNAGKVSNQEFHALVLQNFPPQVQAQDPNLFCEPEGQDRVFLGIADQSLPVANRLAREISREVDPADLVQTMRDYMEILKKIVD